MAKIFVLDDDKSLCEMLCYHLLRLNHETAFALTLEDGVQEIKRWQPDVVFLDVQLPDGNGLNKIAEIRNLSSQPEVIIITGQGDPDGAELAIKNGAWDYIEKPSSVSKMSLPLMRVMEYRKEKSANESNRLLNLEGIVGESQQLKDCLQLIAKASASQANVLISGETGTGKELFAKAIHKNSIRSNQNLVTVDCASLPNNLVESILFGHEKGAFTGANTSRVGLIKQADGGTLFLDEVGELPLSIQKSFLRVLQEKKFRPVGAKTEKTSNFRLIAATHRNLQEMVQKSLFREDLMFRLQSIWISIPPLRERKKDIRDIVLHSVSRISERDQVNIKGITPEYIQTLESYDWPGNIRELINAVETSLSFAESDHTLFSKHLPTNIRVSVTRDRIDQTKSDDNSSTNGALQDRPISTYSDFKNKAVNRAEKQYLLKLIASSNNDLGKALEIAALSRSRLYALMKKHDIYFK